MTDIDALIEQLIDYSGVCHTKPSALLREAAAVLAELRDELDAEFKSRCLHQKEVAERNGEIAKLNKLWNNEIKANVEAGQTIADLRDENKRLASFVPVEWRDKEITKLRKALKQIANYPIGFNSNSDKWAAGIARAALGGGK